MYDGYKHLAGRQLPNATFIVDAFHYIRYVMDASTQSVFVSKNIITQLLYNIIYSKNIGKIYLNVL